MIWEGSEFRMACMQQKLVNFVEAFANGQLGRGAHIPNEYLRMDALLYKRFHLFQNLHGQEHHRGGAVAHLCVLGHGYIHERFGGGVFDLEQLHDGGAVVADGDGAAVGDELVHAAGAEGGAHGVRDGLACVDVGD